MSAGGKSAAAYPLSWPPGWPRTAAPRRARFKVDRFGQVRDGLVLELERMGIACWNVVISSNAPLKRDGMPYATFREPDDPGVAVYWHDGRAQQSRCMASDRWDHVIDNARALQLSLGALRGLDRWGSSEIVQRAFDGFRALPATGVDWRIVLGFETSDEISLRDAKDRYRELARSAHPDVGGDPHQMQRLNLAMDAAGAELEGHG